MVLKINVFHTLTELDLLCKPHCIDHYYSQLLGKLQTCLIRVILLFRSLIFCPAIVLQLFILGLAEKLEPINL
jgi:hypothetical protein